MDMVELKRISDEYDEAQKNWNLSSKRVFHEAFTEILSKKEELEQKNNKEELDELYEVFKEWVGKVGKAWNVKRSVPDECREDFCLHLWKNLAAIKAGIYDFLKNACEMTKMNEETQKETKKHAYSYESKVCFVIAPEEYKLIYDSYNLENMKTILDSMNSKKTSYAKITKDAAAFKKYAAKCIEKYKSDIDSCLAKYREQCHDELFSQNRQEGFYFMADYLLWSGKVVKK